MGSDWFCLAREYVVLRLVLSCQMVCGALNMGSDWFYLARVCGAYNMGSDWFYLAREYVVPIIWVQTGFVLPESRWCL